MKKTVLSLFLVSISFIAFSQNIKTVEILTSAQCSMCKETLESNIAFEKGIKDVFLDMESKKLKVTFKSNKTTINISFLDPGIYLCRLTNNKNQITILKFIKT